MRKKTYPERQKALDLVHDEIAKQKNHFTDLEWLENELPGSREPDKTAEYAIGHIFVAEFDYGATQSSVMEIRLRQAFVNVRTAFMLSAYCVAHQSYPDALGDLVPEYLSVVPQDLFVEKPLIYEKTERGYRFDSVGANHQDDQSRGDNQSGDDLMVTMPSK